MNWDESIESLLQKYCDEAQTRRALHVRSYYRYKQLTSCFSIPVIVLSALSGSFQFLSKGYPKIEQMIVTCTASVSILTSIISAVAAYLKLGQSTAAHETSSNAWLLFHNEVKHQLGLRRTKRLDAIEFLQTCKTQYDRLFELSPICTSNTIAQIKKKIQKHATEHFETPSYLNGFKHTVVFRTDDDSYEENSV